MVSTKNALALAGGGVAGIAWETGFLLGLLDEAPELIGRLLQPSTALIGTSAGSTVAAQIATGNRLSDLFDRQVASTTHELNADIDMREFGRILQAASQGASSAAEVSQRIGTLAIEADTVPGRVRRAVIESRLSDSEWPDWPAHRGRQRR